MKVRLLSENHIVLTISRKRTIFAFYAYPWIVFIFYKKSDLFLVLWIDFYLSF